MIQRYREELQARHDARRTVATDPREMGSVEALVAGRKHLDPSVIQKAVRRAVLASGMITPATSHTFRFSLATHLLKRGPVGVRSPADLL